MEALDKWREGADFACLVSPFYQYPSRSSQIYAQAIRYNVALLSYAHLAFMVQHAAIDRPLSVELRALWEVGKSLRENRSASAYWSAVDGAMLQLTGRQKVEWEAHKSMALARLPEQGAEQIAYWEGEKASLLQLSRDELVEALVEALKIDEKIAVIQKTTSGPA